MPNLWIIFTTGLIAGGLTCAAVQGGLLAATIATNKGNDPKKREVAPILAFLIAKLIAYTILGFLLGWLGSFFQISLKLQAGLLIAVAIFMIGTALAFLNIHPIFRYFIIQPPRFLTRIVRKQTKSQSVFGPAILGIFTIFIPCGTTQAMMAFAVASGNPVWGAVILFTFVLGTFPLFFLIGYSMEWLKDVLQQRFAKIAAFTIIVMALWNLNIAAIASGSPISAQKILTRVYCTISFCSAPSGDLANNSNTNITVTFNENGYSVDQSSIPAGQTIKMTLKNSTGRGCIQAFTIPRLGIQEIVPVGQTKVISFTAPTDTNELDFSCSMGMYGGTLNIVPIGT